MQSDSPTTPTRASLLLPGLLLLFLALVYAPTLQFDRLVYDGARVVQQPVVQGPWSLQKLLTTDHWGDSKPKAKGTYRPAAVAFLWLEARLWGRWIPGYYLCQIIWMFAICLMVVWLALRLQLSKGWAWCAGFFFAVHPVHTDVVASVTGIADLMMAFFLLAALWMHQSKLRFNWLWASCLFALGLGAKEFGIVFVGVVLVWDLFVPRQHDASDGWSARIRGLSWRHYLAYGGIAFGYLTLRAQALGAFTKYPYGPMDNPLIAEGLGTRWLNAPALLWRYVELFLFPTSLSPNRTFNAVPVLRSPWHWEIWAGLGVIVTVCALLWRLRKHHSVPFLLCFAGGALILLLNVLTPSPVILADRWLFLASIPLSLLLVLGISVLYQRAAKIERVLRIGLVLFGLSMALITFDYARHWGSIYELFRYASENAPNSLKARYIYATELQKRARHKDALKEFQATIRIKPGFVLGHIGVARTYEAMGKVKRAEMHLRALSARLGKKDPAARIQLFLLLRRHRRMREARIVDLSIKRDFAGWMKQMKKRHKRQR